MNNEPKNLIVEERERTESCWKFDVKNGNNPFAEVNMNFVGTPSIHVKFDSKCFLELVLFHNHIYVQFNEYEKASNKEVEYQISIFKVGDTLTEYSYHDTIDSKNPKFCFMSQKPRETIIYRTSNDRKSGWEEKKLNNVTLKETVEAEHKEGIDILNRFREELNKRVPIGEDVVNYMIKETKYPLGDVISELTGNKREVNILPKSSR